MKKSPIASNRKVTATFFRRTGIKKQIESSTTKAHALHAIKEILNSDPEGSWGFIL